MKKIKIYIKMIITYIIIFLVRIIFPIENFNQIDFIFGMIHGFTTYYWFEKLEKESKL